MLGHIDKISTTIPNSPKKIDIDLQGKNLILIGANGCGKTRFITHMYEYLQKRVVQRINKDPEKLKNEIMQYEKALLPLSKADMQYVNLSNHVKSLRTQYNEWENAPIQCNNLEQLVISYHENKSILSFFGAMRKAEIKPPAAAASIESIREKDKNNKDNSSSLFEEYLVSNMTSLAYAESKTIGNNAQEAKRIRSWFEKLNNDFRLLFESPSLALRFDHNKYAFYIEQEDREPYRFQQLSSGFSSILSVYADLLTKVELRSISPDEMGGVVFIDEIDAHLHVSLQKKIFSFLTSAFPKIQFIITTHSPFVVSSVSDAIIYDISSQEQVNDLSMYSYESILEGLFDVSPVSKILENKITTLNKLSGSARPNMAELAQLVSEISPHIEKLDSESAYFLNKAKIALSKRKTKALGAQDV